MDRTRSLFLNRSFRLSLIQRTAAEDQRERKFLLVTAQTAKKNKGDGSPDGQPLLSAIGSALHSSARCLRKRTLKRTKRLLCDHAAPFYSENLRFAKGLPDHDQLTFE